VSEQKLILNPQWEHAQFVSIAELKECEQKLEAANERIKLLEEDLIDAKNKAAALVADVALYEDRGERIKRLEDIISRAKNKFFRHGSNGTAASGMLDILGEVRKP